MEDNTPDSHTLFPHETGHGHHRSARERQRKGPMWGCLAAMLRIILVVFVVGFVVVGGFNWFITRAFVANYVRTKVETTLELRLGREVTIGPIEVVRSGLFAPTKVILHDLKIANAPGGVSPHFATVERLEINGGVGSFRTRTIDVGRIDIVGLRLNFEVFPAGSALTHNFPQWKSGPKSRYEIVRLNLNELFLRNGSFLFLDRKHDITGEAVSISSDMRVTRAENLYVGVLNSPRFVLRIQDYLPIETDMRGGFRFTPGVLALNSLALRGKGIEAFVSGKLDPLAQGVYDFRVTSQIGLERVREIFKVEKLLAGNIALDTRLTGKQGDFRLAGSWLSPGITADTYEITDAKGRLDVTGNQAVVDVDSGRYGGGNIGAHYLLTKYAEPYPMSVQLRYNGISIEHLFSDWGVNNTGLRGAATGQLTYGWNKDKVLDGAGEGTARLARNGVAFSKAKYPIPLGGTTDFALNRGVVTFRSGELDTAASHISVAGTLRIEDLFTNLQLQIRSTDFSELDRVAYNFARSADKKDFELLGLAGSGTIVGTVQGPIKEPAVVARIAGNAIAYNNVVLGNGDIDLRYNGERSLLTFERAVFNEGAGRLTLTGTVAFPDRGPSPRFDIALDALNYPVERAIKAVELKFVINGLGTGRMIVAGTPDSGKVSFAGMSIRRRDSDLRLQGDIAWATGEGNINFDLDINARDFPVEDIAAFFDFGTLPVTGQLTGTLHLEGPKNRLEGSGNVTVRKGVIYGEPVDSITARIAFTEGKLRAQNVSISAPAGQITGDAEVDLTTNNFSYNITSGSLDLSKVKLLAGLQELFGGRLVIRSTGAGTFERPELVLEATLNEATLRGLNLPADAPPPSLYVAIRNGRLTIRGSAANVLSIEGEGALGENLAVDGNVRVTVTDIAKLMALSPNAATLPASGNLVIDLRLGGQLSPLEALVIEGSVPALSLRVSEHAFTAARPLRFSMRQGRVTFDDFELQSADSSFVVTGFAEMTGAKRLAVDLRGRLEAALLQLFVADVRANGHLNLAMDVRGTTTAPLLTGSAQLQEAQVSLAGFPQVIDDITGTLLFREGQIEIDPNDALRATVGGGSIIASGYVTTKGLMPERARLNLLGTDVALRYFEGITIEGDFELRLTGDAERMLIQGEVAVDRGLYFRDFDLQQALLNVILSRRGIAPIVAATWQDRVDLIVHMTAPQTLAVRNNLADLTGSATLDVRGTLANPVVLGTVDLDEGGTVVFQNVEYRVARGTINFQNPFRIDPYFDVTLEGRVSSAGFSAEVESGPIELTVNITGTIDHISPTITSDPPASDITLFSLIGLGGLTRQTTDGSSAPGAGLVGQSLILQSLISGLGSRILPFADSFTYDPGLLDTTGAGPAPRVTFEKRVSDNVRLLVVYNMTTHESKEVIEWLANRDWTLQLTRDEQQREYRIDARFRRRYDGRWTWGDRGRGDAFMNVEEPTVAQVTPAPPTTDVSTIPVDGAVAELRFTADGGFDTSALQEYVTVKPGAPLSRREVQSSIKALYGTGNFRDVRVDATPTDAGMVVTFTLSLNYRIERITFDGLTRSERRTAEREATVRPGEVLSLNAVDDSAVELQEDLVRAGYLEATVDPETTFVRQRNAASVTFVVTRGPQAKVAAVQIEGDVAPFTTAQLIDRMREKPGRVFRSEEARRDAERMRGFAAEKGHRRADVDYLGHTYDKATKTVALRYRATVGPIVRIEVAGVPRRAVRRLLPFRGSDEYSEDEVERTAQNIVRSYQERGYFNATVDPESRREQNVWTTTFNVNSGPRYQLKDVQFAGNARLDDKELAAVIATSPRGGVRGILARLFRRPTGVTREGLTADRDAIESHYRLMGFSEATVGAPAPATRPDGTLVVTFPIVEGPQTILTQVNIEGVEQASAADLPQLQLRAGAPFNPQLLRDDVVALQTFYAERGNVEVQISERTEVSPDKTSARVNYVIAEGPRITVDEVAVGGNTYTDSEVILRKADLEKGDPFSYTKILEAQQNLYRLGIFSRVDVQPESTGTSVGDRNVAIKVEEGRNLSITGSVGLRAERAATSSDRTVSFRLAGGVAHRNLFGTGRYLGLEAVATTGGITEQEFFLTYREPFIGRFDVPVQLTVFQTDDATRKGAKILQRGTSIEASRVARYRTRWSLQYQYKIAECREGELCSDEFIIPGVDRNLLDIQISSVTPTFFWDRRNDVINPTRGFFTSASVEYAFKLFAADANFTKEFIQGAWYIPVSERSTFVLAGRVGLLQRLADDDLTTPEDESLIPLSERFTAGGDTTHRAFPLDLLGTLCVDNAEAPDQGPAPKPEPEEGCEATLVDIDDRLGRYRVAPIGGNGLLVVNAEYRFPVFGAVGGAVFADIGNVFASGIHFDDLRYGLGAGVRYLSPVGPLRFDVGFPLERRRPYEKSFSYTITLGYAF